MNPYRKSEPGDPLTHRQLEVYRFIKAYFRKHAKAPTRQQIQDAFGFRSPNAAQDVVMTLVAKGALGHRPGKRRGIFPQAYTPPEIATDEDTRYTVNAPSRALHY